MAQVMLQLEHDVLESGFWYVNEQETHEPYDEPLIILLESEQEVHLLESSINQFKIKDMK